MTIIVPWMRKCRILGSKDGIAKRPILKGLGFTFSTEAFAGVCLLLLSFVYSTSVTIGSTSTFFLHSPVHSAE